jgi:uncharacterized metal-binding protein YceD (DUF177 family)
VSSTKRPFAISFAGLKIGKHEYAYQIEKSFFEEYEYSAIEDADLQVQVTLDKKETMMIVEFDIKGEVTTTCDRCMDPLKLDLEADYKQIFKFGEKESEDETLTVLHPDEHEIDVKSFIYEFIIVSLPGKIVHPKGECNEEMMATMQKYNVNLNDDDEDIDDEDDEDDEDSRSVWSILNDLN